MKVLFVGHFRDNSGWARAAQEQVLALDSVGVDVVVRCIKMTQAPPGELPKRILELERKDAAGCDVVVQNVLPSLMERVGEARQVAYYFAEFDSLPGDWGPKVALLDESWVPNLGVQNAEMRTNGDVDRRFTIVPCATDVGKYRKGYEPHAIRKENEGRFIFYTVGEGYRKNFRALLKAFHAEFRPEEPVELLVKTSVPGVPPAEAKRLVLGEFAKVKQELGLYPLEGYKRELVITDRFGEVDLMRLHASCDCYVNVAYGEGWGIPTFDAMALGKTPIYSEVSGHEAFMSNERGYPVPTTPDVVCGLNDGIHDGRQWWRQVNVPYLMGTMRQVYEARGTKSHLDRARAGVLHAGKFNYHDVGLTMKNALEQGGLS